MTSLGVEARPTALYRFFDEAEGLLYVGISSDPSHRFKDHATYRAWWKSVATIQIKWFDSLQAARAMEVQAIHDEQPVHNRMHSNMADRLLHESGVLPKSRAIRLRRTAERRGYRLLKSRRRDPKTPGYGRWQIVPADQKHYDAGDMVYKLTLDDVEQFLNGGQQ